MSWGIALLALLSCPRGQGHTTLDDYLTRIKLPRSIAFNAQWTTLHESRGRPSLLAFGLKTVSVGGMSVVCPIWLEDSSEIDSTHDQVVERIASGTRLNELFAGLNDPQWRNLISDGLSRSDLNADQVALWEKIMPPHLFWVREPTARSTNPDEEPPPTTFGRFSAEERAQMKLVLSLEVEMQAHTPEEAFGVSVIDESATERLRIQSVSYDGIEEREKAQGMRARNDLKKSDLDYSSATLDATVALEPKELLMNLVGRISKLTGLEIRADIRAGSFPITGSATSARAGDVLKAMAYMVGGTYRKVGPLYMLTGNLTGSATQSARRDEKASVAIQGLFDEGRRFSDLIPKGRWAQVELDERTEALLPPAMRAEAQKNLSRVEEPKKFLLGDLPLALRAILTKQLNDTLLYSPGPIIGVSFSSSPRVQIRVPSGALAGAPFDAYIWPPRESESSSDDVKPVAHKLTTKDVLVFKLGETATPEVVVGAARSRGARRIAVETWDEGSYRETCRLAGEEIRVSWVYAHPPQADNAETGFVNIFGETAKQALAHWRSRLGEEFEMSYLGNISLPRVPAWVTGVEPILFCAISASDVEPQGFSLDRGDYSVSNRVAFIREQSYDPVDIAPFSDSAFPEFVFDGGDPGSSQWIVRQPVTERGWLTWQRARKNRLIDQICASTQLPFLVRMPWGPWSASVLPYRSPVLRANDREQGDSELRFPSWELIPSDGTEVSGNANGSYFDLRDIPGAQVKQKVHQLFTEVPSPPLSNNTSR